LRRVAARLLNPVRLSQLIAKTLDEYERIAIDLATVSTKLAVIKTTFVGDCLTVPLFATYRLTRHIEATCTAMYRRRPACLPPDQVIVPD